MPTFSLLREEGVELTRERSADVLYLAFCGGFFAGTHDCASVILGLFGLYTLLLSDMLKEVVQRKYRAVLRRMLVEDLLTFRMTSRGFWFRRKKY